MLKTSILVAVLILLATPLEAKDRGGSSSTRYDTPLSYSRNTPSPAPAPSALPSNSTGVIQPLQPSNEKKCIYVPQQNVFDKKFYNTYFCP